MANGDRTGSRPDQADIIATLRRVGMFSAFEDEDLEAVAAQMTFSSVRRGMSVFNEGEGAHALYVIHRGRVKVYITDAEGNELILRSRGPGESFGELALLDDESRCASVMATEPCAFLVLSKERFRSFIAGHARAGLHLAKHLVLQIRQTTEDVRSLGLMDVYQRTVRVLLNLAQASGDQLIIEPRPTNQEIARRVGASRERVSRILSELTRGDYLLFEGNKIVVNRKLPAHW